MHIPHTHEWALAPKEAIVLQKSLAQRVRMTAFSKTVRIIAGVDVSLERFGSELFAGVVVLSFPDFEVIETSLVRIPVTMPYIPGLLSFREIPGLLQCFEKLKTIPDVIVVDGQGIAHPRHLGIAAHLGVLLDLPTIGVAKSRLYGQYTEPEEVGDENPILDPKTGNVLGVALKSKKNSNPLLISPGHNMDVASAARVVSACLRGYRLPEPTRQAHRIVNEFRTKSRSEER
jgi:deoxyribonuclease V